MFSSLCCRFFLNLEEETRERNPQIISKLLLEKEKEFNIDGLKFPMELKDINKFEKLNPEIAVNVFGYEKNKNVFPLRISELEEREHTVTLLFLDDKHHVLINGDDGLSRLLTKQMSKHDGKR